MSQSMSVALIGPNTARGGAVLAALEPLAAAIDLVGLSATTAGDTFDWQGKQTTRPLDAVDLGDFEAIISAEPIDLPTGAAPCLSLIASNAPIVGVTLGAIQRIADPVATAVARVLGALDARVSGVDLTVLDAASAHDRPGMDELRDQTIALLNFRPLPTAVFDRRLAFDLLFDDGPREAAVQADIATLCPDAPPATVSRVVVPAFIGAAVDLRLRGELKATDLIAALDAAGFTSGTSLAEVTDGGRLQTHRPVPTPDGARVWLLVDDLQWGAGAAALDFLARIRASTV